MEGTIGALAHASHNEERERLFEIQRTRGLKAYLEAHDGPFQPEPMGPKSARGCAERAAKTKAKGESENDGKKADKGRRLLSFWPQPRARNGPELFAKQACRITCVTVFTAIAKRADRHRRLNRTQMS